MIRQNPFSIYDFLGYLIPGSIVIYAYLIIEYFKVYTDFEVEELAECLSGYGIDNLFFFIIISYLIGHIMSFCSSISIENYANWRYNYPSKYLLNFPHKGYFSSSATPMDFAWRVIIFIGLLPVTISDFVLGHLLRFKNHYRKSLDKMLRDLITKKINILLERLDADMKEEIEDAKPHDFHRIVTHYAFETSKRHQAKMSNYVALYGFLRTLSLIFNLLAWCVFTRVLINRTFIVENYLIIIALSLVAYICFMAFMKFYRRYTLEGFMVITVNEELK